VADGGHGLERGRYAAHRGQWTPHTVDRTVAPSGMESTHAMGRAVPWLFLGASLWGAWFTYNGFRPIYRHARRSVLSFFAGWLTTELAIHHLAWQVLLAGVFVGAGALRAWPGWAGLAVTLVSWAGLVRLFTTAGRSEAAVARALDEGLGEGWADAILPAVR